MENKVYTLEERNALVLKLQEKEEFVESSEEYQAMDLEHRLEVRNEIMELKIELGHAKLFDGNTEDCENCGA